MYEEMVRALRDEAAMARAGDGHRMVSSFALNALANAIEELSKLADAIPHICECCVGCELEKKNGGCDNAFVLSPKRAMQYLNKPRWIPVTERLPENGSDILAVQSYADEVRIVPANYDRGVWYDCCFNRVAEHITHWMPPPQPPTDCRQMVTDSNQVREEETHGD